MTTFYNVEKQSGICVDDHLDYENAVKCARNYACGDYPMFIREFKVDKDGNEIDQGITTIL